MLAHGVHPGAPAVAGWVFAALVVLAPTIGYLRAVHARGRAWPRRRTAAFVAGTVLVAVAVCPPVQSFAHLDPRGHMVQHLLLGMFAPLPLVLAAPGTPVLGAVPVARRRAVAGVLRSAVVHGLTHPVTTAVLDLGGLYLLYLTPLHAVGDPLVRHLVNLHLLIAGCLFTWSVAGPDPAPRRPGLAVRVAVLVAAGGAHAYLAKLLYARAGTAAEAAAAQLMFYGGDVAELLLAVALFAAWYRRTGRRRDPPGPVTSALICEPATRLTRVSVEGQPCGRSHPGGPACRENRGDESGQGGDEDDDAE